MHLKKYFPFILSLVFFNALTNTSISQSYWKNLYNGKSITNIVSKGKELWAGTSSGLANINLENDEIKLYDKSHFNQIKNLPHPLLINQDGELVFNYQRSGLLFFNKNSIHGFGSPTINSIVEDKEKQIWAGFSYGGIEMYEIGYNQVVCKLILNKKNSPLPSNNIVKMMQDKKDNLWIATYEYDAYDTLNAGIAKFDGKNWEVFTKKNAPFETNQITSLTIDKSNNIWVGTEKRNIYKYDGKIWSSFEINSISKSVKTVLVSSMAVDSSNNIWVGTLFNGLHCFNGTSWKAYDAGNCSLESSFIYSIEVDYRGRVWVGTEIGLYKYEGGDFKEVHTGNFNLPSQRFRDALKDSKENIWFIADDYGSPYPYQTSKTTCGIVKYNGNSFSFFPVSELIGKPYMVYSITIDYSDNLWIAVNNGLIKYDGKNWIQFSTGFPIGFQAESMCTDYYGNIWMGESDGTISKFDGKNYFAFSTNQYAYKTKWISTLYFDGTHIYAGDSDSDALLKIDPLKSKTNLANEKINLPFNQVSSVVRDNKGVLWVSSYEKGIARYVNSNWELLNRNNSGLLSEKVSSIYLTDDKKLIFGCRESASFPKTLGGISIFDGINWKNYSYDNTDLVMSFINSVITDNNNNIWSIGYPGVSIMNSVEPDIAWKEKNSTETQLFQNFPNPFNNQTLIKYSLPEKSIVSISIYNSIGKLVRTMESVEKEKGTYFEYWDARDDTGQVLPSGVYFCKLVTNSSVLSKKMLFLK